MTWTRQQRHKARSRKSPEMLTTPEIGRRWLETMAKQDALTRYMLRWHFRDCEPPDDPEYVGD